MEFLIIFGAFVPVGFITFIGVWWLRGYGFRELLPWARPAQPPSGTEANTRQPAGSSGR